MRRGNINNKESNEKVIISENPDFMINVETTNPMENKDEEKLAQNESTKTKNVNNTKNIIRIVLLIIICVILVGLTAGLLVCKYNSTALDNENKPTQSEQESTHSIKAESKDSKYLVQFSDMYTYNPITLKEIEHKEGTIKIDGENQDKVDISYIQIAGLTDSKIQEKINKEIKDAAFVLNKDLTANQQYGAYTYVEGNFSNILSIQVGAYVYENNECVKEQETFLNFNLVTGERIKFLDLFADNTPMNSIIYELKYKELAWDTEMNLDMSEKEWDKATNMDKRDTSEYEDIILQSINRYKKIDKDTIEFFVTPNRIVAYLDINEGEELKSYVIDLYKYADYVTLFKKFLTDKVIYQNIPGTKALVFNDYFEYIPKYHQTDNLFLCIFDESQVGYIKEKEKEEIEQYSSQIVSLKKKLLKQHKEKVINEVKKLANKNTNKGYISRFIPYASIDEYSNKYGEESIICVNFYGIVEEMTKDYFTQNAYKLLAKQSAAPKVSVDDALVGALDHNNKNIKSILYDKNYKPIFELDAYYTLDGKKIANSYEEVEEYIDNKYKDPQEGEGVEIYKEENI